MAVIERAAITGSEGFLAKHLREELLGHGTDTLVYVDRSIGRDLTDLDSFSFQKCEAVFHLATIGLRESIKNPEYAIKDIIAACVNTCERALRDKCFLVNCSSSEVFGSAYHPLSELSPRYPCTPYAAAKVAQDAIVHSWVRTYGLRAMTVRPFNMYGPGSHWQGDRGELIPKMIVRALAGKPLEIYGDGTQARDFVYVKDVARIIRWLASDPAIRNRGTLVPEFNIATGISTSVREIAEMISELVGGVEITYCEGRPGDVQRHNGDSTLLRSFLDPKFTPIREGLKSTIEWFKSLPNPETLHLEETSRNWR